MTDSSKQINIIRKTKTRGGRKPWPAQKERKYQELVQRLESAGFTVRREELKRGPNWRVVSGSCRSVDRKLVFIDSRLSPDDQISFLLGKVADLPDENLVAA